jgi:hypothetical protein
MAEDNITPDQLIERVDNAPGKVALATLRELRSAYKRGRITIGVLDDIKSRLESDHRIGVIHDGAEPEQTQEVYLYKQDAPIGAFLHAGHHPSDPGLRRLRDVTVPAKDAAEADERLATLKSALLDATVALNDYLGEDAA